MPRSKIRRKMRILCCVAVVLLGAAVPARAVASPRSTSTERAGYADYCGGHCSDVLPGGQGGGVPTWKFLQHLAETASIHNVQADNSSDQRSMYEALSTNYRGLTEEKIGQFFNSSSFGVPSDAPRSVLAPGGRSDVTISRDSYGIPHIKGSTRDGTTFGAGYAIAEDRLWVMDLMRHVADGSAVEFAGERVKTFEDSLWPAIAQTEADRQAQLDRLAADGPEGRLVVHDIESYTAGINRYIDDIQAKGGPLGFGSHIPIEYKGTGNVSIPGSSGINKFKPTDVVALVCLLGGQFGGAGGGQVLAAVSKLAAEKKYGRQLGDKVWESLRAANDPETTVTVRDGVGHAYGVTPANSRPAAMPDPGSVTLQPASAGGGGGSGPRPGATGAGGTVPRNFLGRDKGMSNALVVSGKHTKSGSPIAVFGPQVGYFAPEILALQEVQGPGLSARGAVFPGTGPYVLVGRGTDYSWSPTSAQQSIVDTYAVKLCEVDGGPATKESDGYRYRGGECLPMERLTSPDKLQIQRTKYGIVKYRATVGGVPVAYTSLRSTYRNELASAVGFKRFNDPNYVTGPKKFQEAASAVDFTFNWFYVDAAHSAYFNSGLEPVRAENVDPDLPIWATPENEWKNWNPATNTSEVVPMGHHPQSVDQDYYVNWNNTSAQGQVATSFGDSSVHRVDLLDDRVKKLIANGSKIDRADLVQAMADAGVTDLRGAKILPNLLQVIYSDARNIDPVAVQALRKLQRWMQNGARRTTIPGAKVYIDNDAIKIMDAWWPLLVKAQFQPRMGQRLYAAVAQRLQIDEAPSTPVPGGASAPHHGTAFQYGWWSYVDKDLRSTLGQKVDGPLPASFCGTLPECRSTLMATLKEAVGKSAAEVYPKDQYCDAGDQWCADSIQFQAVGAIEIPGMAWQNRSTYQQVAEFRSHR